MTRFLKAFFDAVRDMPSTQVQIAVGVGLAVVYVLGSMFGFFLIGITAAFRLVPINILPNQDVHQNIGQFILIYSGLGVGQFVGKRFSTKPELVGKTKETQGQVPTEEVG